MTQTQALFFKDWENAHIPEILEEIYLHKVYAPYLLGKKDLIIVDIGQNIGIFSFYASRYAKRVIGLEPSTMHQDTLKEMIKYNKLTNVEVLPYGLSNTNGEKTFYLAPNNTAYSLIQTMPDIPTETIKVIDMKKLFELAKIDHIDLLKLDCEGEESKVIMSAAFEEVAPKIKMVLGEYHDWTEMNKVQFKNRFEELGYDFKWNPGTKAATFSAIRL